MKSKVYTQDKTSYTLGKELGGGGEGTVYRVQNHPTLCIKLLNDPEPRREKLEAMLQSAPQGGQGITYAWPMKLVFEDNLCQKFAGFVMPVISADNKLALEAFRKNENGALLWKLNVGRNFCLAIQSLHDAGHRVGDLRDVNFMVNDLGQVTLMDCDSFQIGSKFPSEIGFPDYQPIEWLTKKMPAGADRLETDCWGLAVILWRLLNNAFHPFQYIGVDDLSEAVIQEKTPIVNSRYTYPPSAPPVSILLPDLHQLFVQTFGQGARNPKKRTKPEEFAKALDACFGMGIHVCAVDPSHQWVKRTNPIDCPYCQRGDTTGIKAPTQRLMALQPVQPEGVPPLPPSSRKPKSHTVRNPSSTSTRSRSSSSSVVRRVSGSAHGFSTNTIWIVLSFLRRFCIPSSWSDLAHKGVDFSPIWTIVLLGALSFAGIKTFDWVGAVWDYKKAVMSQKMSQITSSFFSDFRPDAQVISVGLNVRATPSARGVLLGALKHHEKVKIQETQNDWAKVVSKSGLKGWAKLRYLQRIP